MRLGEGKLRKEPLLGGGFLIDLMFPARPTQADPSWYCQHLQQAPLRWGDANGGGCNHKGLDAARPGGLPLQAHLSEQVPEISTWVFAHLHGKRWTGGKWAFFIIKIKVTLCHAKCGSRQFFLSCAHKVLGVAWQDDPPVLKLVSWGDLYP